MFSILISCVVILTQVYGLEHTEDYLVNTPKCKIPDLNPFNDEVQWISIPENYTSCRNLSRLSYINKTNDFVELRIKKDLVPLYAQGGVSCCYLNVTRDGSPVLPDVGIRFSRCIPFNGSVVIGDLPVVVRCFSTQNGSFVYENAHYPVTIRDDIKQKLATKRTKKPLSVLFIVVDSVSRLNLIRTMPKTRDFLLENDFVELKGYNKIDDNTFPNCMAFLTGFNLLQSRKICNPKILNKLDECPMIWYRYRDLGYITAYAEDHAVISTFNYLKKGFTKPPTDYYFKPYVEAAEYLGVVEKDGMPYCAGPETSGERILEVAKDFSVTFKNDPSFGVFWMNTFSHNAINSPYGMDGRLESFFNDLKHEGVFNNSLVVFLSDHGIRFGDIRLTSTGWFEERMPFSLISVPGWFKKQFPNEYRNLQSNANRLTSTFDLYMTLQHVLVLSGYDYKVRPSSACPKCQSLFQQLPLDRSCEDAAVPLEWCTCIGYLRPIEPEHQLVKNTTDEVLREIRNLLSMRAPDLCADYSVRRILNSSVSETVPYSKHRYLFITLETEPSAIFLLTVKFKNIVDEKSLFQIVRFDSYWTTSYCVADSIKKYCFCIDMVNVSNNNNTLPGP